MEEWRPVADFPAYEVSSLGRVRLGDKEKSPFVDQHGYLALNVSHEGASSCVRVHRLVAEAFLPRQEGMNTVDHINQVKTDNRTANLRWSNHQQNAVNRGANKNNTSGHKNICYNARRTNWRVHLSRNGRLVLNKEYPTLDEAITARDEILSQG
jgi:hypothetical protein